MVGLCFAAFFTYEVTLYICYSTDDLIMIANFFSSSLFKQRTFIVLSIVLALFVAINVVVVLLNLESVNYQIPTRYSDFSTSPIERADWQALYVLPAFSVVAAITSLVIAIKIHPSRRDVALAVMSGAIFIQFINVFVSWSLLSLI